ncbi:MAG: cysteine--tRNA ligase [Candidatus Nitrosotenuis sp.]|uniref:Cysteine--tRNA ligase n=1 Tax=Candidatus Nitrosotenuis uzonensis TaxID=1407055 RepID=A0A812EXX5_9ARCH|nr:cysteine--tRNA ligase [Candidatus Nitrosotenuis uzonensis]MCA2004034.1 cysteine--tRNA ligase [Candidatus Nitrosotenuis sp.]CAE6498255.1 Cysteine--tRNA ligase [Candidatus Nitrosotenuis uzonensis]
MRIFDTLRASEEPVNEDNIRIYLCGVTVYDESHIGHARTIIIFDTLRRYLESKGKMVNFVQNFTDVDDKIIKRATAENVHPLEISRRYIDHYFEDFDRLNIKRATVHPKATEHIPEMIELIKNLINAGFAYVSRNGVYYSVAKFPEYGKLSKKKTEDLISGARIEVDETKNDPLDFALWKFSDTEPRWPSPWGSGRPGWHIECSAMSLKYLGEEFEIHGGGRDLIFPHHENEIAQTEAFTKKPLAKLWMHVGMVTINGEKMSKSLGNIKSVRHVLDGWGPNVIRLFCLSGHYSKAIDYSEELLRENLIKWRQVETAYYEMIMADDTLPAADEVSMLAAESRREFDDALESDFNTPLAINAFFKMVKGINRIAAAETMTKQTALVILPEFERMLGILGLQVQKVTEEEKQKITNMIKERDILRAQKQYQEADKMRDQISQMNIVLLDHKNKTIWMKKEKIRADS